MTQDKFYEKLTPENSTLLLIDHQAGLLPLVGNIAPTELKNNVLALAKVAKIFNIPTILTTSFEKTPEKCRLRIIRKIQEKSSPLKSK